MRLFLEASALTASAHNSRAATQVALFAGVRSLLSATREVMCLSHGRRSFVGFLPFDTPVPWRVPRGDLHDVPAQRTDCRARLRVLVAINRVIAWIGEIDVLHL